MPEKLQSRMSSPTSIWLRSIRYLTHEGKPLPRLAPVFIKSTTELLLPFAIMTQTDNNRLICWPVLPKDAPLESEKGRLIDHITLELANGKTHTTAFDARGKRHHRGTGAMLREVSGTGLSPWFTILVRWNVIADQDLRVATDMLSPASDGPRREQVFRKMAEESTAQYVVLPDGPRGGDYVYCMFCLQTGEKVDFEPIAHDYLGQNVDDRIDGFPNGTAFPIMGARLQVGTTKLVALAAAPIGTVRQDLVFGTATARAPARTG